MRVVVIPEDQCVIVGSAVGHFRLSEFPATDANVHAIQWYDDHGVVEQKIGDRIWITDAATVQPYVEAHAVEIALQEAEAAGV